MEKDVSDPKVGVALVLTCMDLRVLDETTEYLHENGLKNEFDHFVVAGAALGVLNKPHWGETFWDHLGLAIKLHKIDEVHIFEHQDCGAYKLLLDPERQAECKDPVQEKHVHHEVARALQRKILERYEGVIKKVELRYIAIKAGSTDGEVEPF
jgi:carbonic anhydrase